MGLGLSTEVDPNDPDAALDGVVDQEYGFRVHRVELGSPGAAAGLQSILDYIVVANGVRLDADDGGALPLPLPPLPLAPSAPAPLHSFLPPPLPFSLLFLCAGLHRPHLSCS